MSIFDGPPRVCATCGHVGPTKLRDRGSYFLLVVLLFCFVVPGLVYLLYMVTGRVLSCRACGSREVIGLDTPRGRELAARYG